MIKNNKSNLKIIFTVYTNKFRSKWQKVEFLNFFVNKIWEIHDFFRLSSYVTFKFFAKFPRKLVWTPGKSSIIVKQ